MSLAVLARKTKTKQRLRSTTCGGLRNGSRTRGFVLNMTGRGHVIGSGAKYNSGGCRGLTGTKCGYGCSGCCEVGCKGGQRYTCCSDNKTVDKKCRKNCKLCWYQGLSQPAPQMSYGVYLARKSSGAHRPSGRACCDCGLDCTANLAANPKKNPNTWKQSPSLSAGTIIEENRLAAIRCAEQQITYKTTMLGGRCISRKRTAKWPCTIFDPYTGQYIQTKCQPLGPPCTRYLNCGAGIKSRLAYPRINKNNCGTTKAIGVGRSAGDQIALRKSEAFSCQCWKEQLAYMTIGAPSVLSDLVRILGWRSARPAKGRAAWGAFKGTVSNLKVRRLQIMWTQGRAAGAQLLLTLLLGHSDQSAPSITSVSFLAADGTTVTQPMPLTWTGGAAPGDGGIAHPPRVVYASSLGDDSISQTLQFFQNYVGQCVKVYWAPAQQNQINDPNHKCSSSNRLFKNPSVRCPSTGKGHTPTSTCI